MQSKMRAAQPTRTGGKRRSQRAAAPALSPTALAEAAEARARAAEAELLEMLDLEEPEEVARGRSSGKGKGEVKGIVKPQGYGGK